MKPKIKKAAAICLLAAMLTVLWGCGKETEASMQNSPDIDLTTMSGTMVYSTVSDMLTSSENYEGQIIKMDGIFQTMKYPESDAVYYFCETEDATACCQQGVEFVPAEDCQLPPVGEAVTLIGTWGAYVEDDILYCALMDAVAE